jgi:hypothetical protein
MIDKCTRYGVPEHCTLCGSPVHIEVAVGMTGAERGPRFECGTIYWPSKDRVTVIGAACEIIQGLRSQIEQRDLVLIEVAAWLLKQKRAVASTNEITYDWDTRNDLYKKVYARVKESGNVKLMNQMIMPARVGTEEGWVYEGHGN